MTRGTRGICTGGGVVLAFTLLAGCAQKGQNSQQTTHQSTQAAPQAAQPAATPVQAVANAAGGVVNAAAGAVTGAVGGAVNGVTNGAQPQQHRPRVKPNGRGGFDSSEVQADAIRRAHLASARYGVTKVTRAHNGVLAGQPSTRPTTASAR